MAIIDSDTWLAARSDLVSIAKTAAVTVTALQWMSTLDMAGAPGAGALNIGNTANGLKPTDATAGFPTIRDFVGGATGYLKAWDFGSSVTGRAVQYDRVWHAGSYLLTSLATTNLTAQPTFTDRLPGGTDYSDIELFLEFNAAVSATATTVSIGYTNEAGTSGRSTGATATLASTPTRRLLRMPLQAGDKNPSRIDSITVGGTVATAGSVNIVLARRLASGRVFAAGGMAEKGWDQLGQEAFQDMALWAALAPDSTSTGTFEMNAMIVNG